jgi:hypothetical protein
VPELAPGPLRPDDVIVCAQDVTTRPVRYRVEWARFEEGLDELGPQARDRLSYDRGVRVRGDVSAEALPADRERTIAVVDLPRSRRDRPRQIHRHDPMPRTLQARYGELRARDVHAAVEAVLGEVSRLGFA